MAKKEVWRLVGGEAVMCTTCPMNVHRLGGHDTCVATDEICIFTKKHVERQEPWDDFHDLYHEINAAEETTE